MASNRKRLTRVFRPRHGTMKPFTIFEYDLPQGVRGFVTERKEWFVILINKSLCPLMKQRTIGHELAHLMLGHLEQPTETFSLQAAETAAERQAWHYYSKYKKGDFKNEIFIDPFTGAEIPSMRNNYY